MADTTIEKIYNVCFDENGYYAGACLAKYSRFEGGIDVEELPPRDETDSEEIINLKLKSHKLVDGSWVFDEERYNQLYLEYQEELNKEPEPTEQEQIKSLEEQVQMLTDCLLEMSELLYV